MDVLKDLGLAAPVRLTVRAGTKGKEMKKRGKPELGDLVNESVPPAVPWVVPVSLTCHPASCRSLQPVH